MYIRTILAHLSQKDYIYGHNSSWHKNLVGLALLHFDSTEIEKWLRNSCLFVIFMLKCGIQSWASIVGLSSMPLLELVVHSQSSTNDNMIMWDSCQSLAEVRKLSTDFYPGNLGGLLNHNRLICMIMLQSGPCSIWNAESGGPGFDSLSRHLCTVLEHAHTHVHTHTHLLICL